MNVQNLKQHFSNLDSNVTKANGNNSNNNNSTVVRTQIPVARFGRQNSSDALLNGKSPHSPKSHSLKSPFFKCTSPLPPSPSPAVSQCIGGSPDKWRAKYEDAERKRKALVTQHQKLSREHEDLQRRYGQVHRDLETTRRELADKDQQLNQLRKLSEAVYREYDQFKNQYELETGSMHQAMQKASQWYRQNRELKRRSTLLMQRVMEVAPGTMVQEMTDDTDSGVSTDDDFEDLRKTVEELNREVARLQAEVNAARLQEFEAQETIVDLTQQLEEERTARSLLESELKELRSMKSNLDQVSRLVAVEVTSLRDQCQREKETAQRMKQDADRAQKERNVLAHQSQLLLAGVEDQQVMQLLMEIEGLKRSLEEEQQRRLTELQTLQEKLEEKESEGQFEILEENFKLAESELHCALERAERAETINYQLSSKVAALEEELEKASRAPVPPPLPPPPPPPPLPPDQAPRLTLRRRPSCDGAEKSPPSPSTPHASSAVLQMANLLGIPRRTTNPPDAAPGAIDDIINQIKGGRFQLKSTEPNHRLQKVEEQPPVVKEMINVLGTLRKRRTPSMRRQMDKPPVEVQL